MTTKYADYAEGTYTKPGYTFDTQIVTNDRYPMGERIFLDTGGSTIARVPLTQGTAYSIVCHALLDAFYSAGKAIWDRDDQMDYHQAVTGRRY